jgi:hypothetical protein
MKRATIDMVMVAAVVGMTVLVSSCESSDGGVVASDATETAMTRLDRMGRVEVTNFMLCFRPYCSDDSIKDKYNHEDPFDVDPANATRYREAFQKGLSRLDGFDRGLISDTADWLTPHPLIDMLMTDHLIVDVTKPCTVDSESYLEIEMAAYRGEAHETCGGRTPNADVIDTTLTLMINGPDRPEPLRGDGVNEPDSPATDTFPYFAPPH